MQFNPRVRITSDEALSSSNASSLKGAKAGHFNAALADELQWSEQDKALWVEICSGQKTFAEFNPLRWSMLDISLGNGQDNWVTGVVLTDRTNFRSKPADHSICI